MDEAARVPDELHFAVRLMLAVSGGLLMLSTPFGKRGVFYEEYTGESGGSATRSQPPSARGSLPVSSRRRPRL